MLFLTMTINSTLMKLSCCDRLGLFDVRSVLFDKAGLCDHPYRQPNYDINFMIVTERIERKGIRKT